MYEICVEKVFHRTYKMNTNKKSFDFTIFYQNRLKQQKYRIKTELLCYLLWGTHNAKQCNTN